MEKGKIIRGMIWLERLQGRKRGGEMAVPHLRQGESQKGRQQDRYKVREEDR